LPHNTRWFSITQAFSIDLTGQVCVDQFEAGGRLYGGLEPRSNSLAARRGPQVETDRFCLTRRPKTIHSPESSLSWHPGRRPAPAGEKRCPLCDYRIWHRLLAWQINPGACACADFVAHLFFGIRCSIRQRSLVSSKRRTINNVLPYPIEEEHSVVGRTEGTIRPSMVLDASDIKALFYGLPRMNRYTRFFRHIRSCQR